MRPNEGESIIVVTGSAAIPDHSGYIPPYNWRPYFGPQKHGQVHEEDSGSQCQAREASA
jgi:hypothetical protein